MRFLGICDPPQDTLKWLLPTIAGCITLALVCWTLLDVQMSSDGSAEVGVHELHDTAPLFLHVGKGGGGTVHEEFRKLPFKIPRCHPRPCRSKMNSYTSFIIDVRDPVDRFVSAFNWRSRLLCNFENESREGGLGPMRFFDRPDRYCKRARSRKERNEKHILSTVYGDDPGRLGEMLCDGGDQGAAAQSHIRQIEHLEDPLVEWLPDRNWDKITVIALVLEPGFDFRRQIGAARKRWEPPNPFGEIVNKRRAPPQQYNSHSLKNVTAAMSLSPLAACCLARYYKEDYEVIRTLQQVACGVGERELCRASIQSILDRRRTYLDASSPCR
mmetsp:Transcript_78261/g.221259  ORF Transcript_78261/g.221259 Transcript_78261/m.221259 type:complete len:328 (-) Transcript_78261:32-1015(-)